MSSARQRGVAVDNGAAARQRRVAVDNGAAARQRRGAVDDGVHDARSNPEDTDTSSRTRSSSSPTPPLPRTSTSPQRERGSSSPSAAPSSSPKLDKKSSSKDKTADSSTTKQKSTSRSRTTSATEDLPPNAPVLTRSLEVDISSNTTGDKKKKDKSNSRSKSPKRSVDNGSSLEPTGGESSRKSSKASSDSVKDPADADDETRDKSNSRSKSPKRSVDNGSSLEPTGVEGHGDVMPLTRERKATTTVQLRDDLNLGNNEGTEEKPKPAGKAWWVWLFDSKKTAEKVNPDDYLVQVRPARKKVQDLLIKVRNELFALMEPDIFDRFKKIHEATCEEMMKPKKKPKKPSSDKPTKVTLRAVLENYKTRAFFTEYCRKAFTVESLECYFLLENIERVDDYEFWHRAKVAYEQYIRPKAKDEVNIPGPLAAAINKLCVMIYEEADASACQEVGKGKHAKSSKK